MTHLAARAVMQSSHLAGIIRGVLSAALFVVLGGCVTGTTIEAAKQHVHYKPQSMEDGKITPLEVESVDKAKPGYYALVPFAVIADLALTPVYVGVIIAVNLGLMKPPY